LTHNSKETLTTTPSTCRRVNGAHILGIKL